MSDPSIYIPGRSNNSRLNQLPKDMLIYIIETMENNLIKHYEKELQDLDLLRQLHIDRCKVAECNAMAITDDYTDVYVYNGCKDMIYCYLCKNSICDSHIDEHNCSN
jgi:hypothetical protein